MFMSVTCLVEVPASPNTVCGVDLREWVPGVFLKDRSYLFSLIYRFVSEVLFNICTLLTHILHFCRSGLSLQPQHFAAGSLKKAAVRGCGRRRPGPARASATSSSRICTECCSFSHKETQLRRKSSSIPRPVPLFLTASHLSHRSHSQCPLLHPPLQSLSAFA